MYVAGRLSLFGLVADVNFQMNTDGVMLRTNVDFSAVSYQRRIKGNKFHGYGSLRLFRNITCKSSLRIKLYEHFEAQ
jgi:hypothetical protein